MLVDQRLWARLISNNGSSRTGLASERPNKWPEFLHLFLK